MRRRSSGLAVGHGLDDAKEIGQRSVHFGVRPAAVHLGQFCLHFRGQRARVNPAFRAISVNNSQWAGSSITPALNPHPSHAIEHLSSRANWPRTSTIDRSPGGHVPDPENRRPIGP